MGKSKDLATGAAYQDQTESDTRYVNASGDTMTGTLVASTRLQVGDSSITQAYPQPSNGYVADFQASSGTQTYISIAPPNASSVGDTGTIFGEDASDTYIMQRGNKNIKLATQELVRLAVDGSGRVTMPSQPSFYAYTSTDYTAEGALTGGSKWSERWDTGNNFSDGTFTAPVAGKYFFSVMWDAKAIRSTLDIQVNTVSMLRYEPTGRTDDTWETHAYSGLLNLSANDAVRLYGRMHSQSSTNPYHMGSGHWGHFSGFLIG